MAVRLTGARGEALSRESNVRLSGVLGEILASGSVVRVSGAVAEALVDERWRILPPIIESQAVVFGPFGTDRARGIWNVREVANRSTSGRWPPAGERSGMSRVLGEDRLSTQDRARGVWGLGELNRARNVDEWPFVPYSAELRWFPPEPVVFESTGVGRTGTIHEWIVPHTGTYDIEVWGAQGGDSNVYAGGGGGKGGRGARMKGTFELNEGDVIKILVGQKATSDDGRVRAAGGGGGTFVVRENAGQTPEPLIVAGGGGGGYTPDGLDALVTNNGTTYGGSNAASGAGFSGDGTGDAWTTAATSYLNGGLGGGAGAYGNEGGFGGGANTHGYDGTKHPGGGGYNGGNSGTVPEDAAGSFNAGTSQDNGIAEQEGDGRVVIQRQG